MELLRCLRRKGMPAKLMQALLLALPGLLLAAGLWSALGALLRGPRDLYALNPDEVEGVYAAAQIDTIYDWYADTVSTAADGTEELIAREYLVPLKDGRTFIGVEVPAELVPTGDHVLEQTMLWQQDPDSYFWDGTYMEVRGTIRPMDGESRDMYYDLLSTYYGLSGTELNNFRPLVLVQGELYGMDGGSITLLGLAALVFLALAAVRLGQALAGGGGRQISRYCGRRADPEACLAELDDLCRQTPVFRLRCDGRWLLYEDGDRSWVLRCEDVAWVYIAGGRGGRCRVMVCSRSESPAARRHEVRVRDRAEARAVIDWLQLRLPAAVFGYTPHWERAYGADPVHFGLPKEPAAPPEPPFDGNGSYP